MRYEEHPPPASVAPFVACLWTLTGEARAVAFELILPDGRPELVVHRGDPFRQKLASGATRRQPRRLVVGQMAGGVAMAPGRRVETVGVRFTPAGLAPLCPFPQARLANRIVAPRRGCGRRGLRTVAAAAAEAPTLADAVDALRTRAAARLCLDRAPSTPRLLTAVARITDSGGDRRRWTR